MGKLTEEEEENIRKIAGSGDRVISVDDFIIIVNKMLKTRFENKMVVIHSLVYEGMPLKDVMSLSECERRKLYDLYAESSEQSRKKK